MYTNFLVTEQSAQAYLAEEKRQDKAWRRNQAVMRKRQPFRWIQRLELSLRRIGRRKTAQPEARPTLVTRIR